MPRPLEPVLEHNRLDLVSLAAVTARALQLVDEGKTSCRDAAEALALGKVYERADCLDRASRLLSTRRDRIRAAHLDVRAEALYRLGLRLRRDRRFAEAAVVWRELLDLTEPAGPRDAVFTSLRQFAAEALAIHHEHRERDYEVARELALFALNDADDEGVELRLDRATRRRRIRAARKPRVRNESRGSSESSPESTTATCSVAVRSAWTPERRRSGAIDGYLAAACFFVLRLVLAAALRLSDVCAPNRLVNRSTRPSVSISFWRPVKNGWQLLQISRCSSGLVDRVFHVAPHAQRASIVEVLRVNPFLHSSSFRGPGKQIL